MAIIRNSILIMNKYLPENLYYKIKKVYNKGCIGMYKGDKYDKESNK